MIDPSTTSVCPELAEGATSENFRKPPIPAANHDILSDKQRMAIELLLAGKNLATVAERVEVSPRTLYAWRQDELFRAALDRRRHELWNGAAERLRALVHPSIDVLEQQLGDEYDRARVRAAGMLLRLADLRKCVPPAKDKEED
ncbi:MAG: hypothetical protein WBD40_16060 [Tepidisphaeraceae bacterium]